MKLTAISGDDLDVETWIKDMMASHGYAQLSVHDPESGLPGYAFTIGLTQSRQTPELFCMGVAPDIAAQLFAHCVAAHDRGSCDLTAKDGELKNVIEGFVLGLRRLPSAVTRLVNAARPDSFNDIKTLAQVLLPDNAGRFPGQPGCDAHIAAAQDADWLVAPVTH